MTLAALLPHVAALSIALPLAAWAGLRLAPPRRGYLARLGWTA